MKKTKKIFMLASVIILAGTKSHSQSVNYTYLENDANKHNFHVALNAFNGDYTSNQSIAIGYGIGFSCAIKKIATAEVCFDKAYAPIMDFNYHFNTKTAYYIVTENKPSKYNHLEAGGMLHLYDKVKSMKRKVTLSSGSARKGNRTYSSHSYMRVPTEARSIFAIRGGFYHFDISISDQDHGTVTGGIPGVGKGGVVTDDGTEFGAAVSSYDSPNYNSKAVTNMHVNGFYAGICKAQFFSVSIDPNGYGKKNNRTYSKVYLDAIIAAPVIDDFKTKDGKTHQVSGGNAKGFETRSVGARLGYEAIKFGNAVAFYYKVEAGIKPGLKAQKFYLSAGFGMALRGKIKLLS